MFTVEWLKDGSPIHKEAMLGANVGDVLNLARTLLPQAKESSGIEPDTIRITDHMTNQTILEAIVP